MAAQDPQLEMKLQNMPIPITAEMVNGAVGSVLQAAEAGKLDLVETLQV
jgi:alcohol dehydrogenase